MNLYNSYCYETLDLAATSFQSKILIENLGLISSYSLISTNTVQFTFLPLSQFTKSVPVYSYFNIYFPDCSMLGFDNSFFGVSATESALLAFSVVSLLSVAYYFQVLKKLLV